MLKMALLPNAIGDMRITRMGSSRRLTSVLGMGNTKVDLTFVKNTTRCRVSYLIEHCGTTGLVQHMPTINRNVPLGNTKLGSQKDCEEPFKDFQKAVRGGHVRRSQMIGRLTLMPIPKTSCCAGRPPWTAGSSDSTIKSCNKRYREKP